jgi:hypothetical protein
VLEWMFLGGEAPAAPFPACGTGAAGDRLPCEAYASCS